MVAIITRRGPQIYPKFAPRAHRAGTVARAPSERPTKNLHKNLILALLHSLPQGGSQHSFGQMLKLNHISEGGRGQKILNLLVQKQGTEIVGGCA